MTPEELARHCAAAALDKKAENVQLLDLRGISTFTDFFVICSGTSEPHLKAISNEIQERLKKDHGVRPMAVDGYPASHWVVLDYAQVLVHIFDEERRDYYALEALWSDAPRIEIAAG